MGFDEIDYQEQQERLEDDRQIQGLALAEKELQSEEAKLKWKYVEHKTRGSTHDDYFDELLRLSNLDGPANIRLRFYFSLLFKVDDLGPRARKFAVYLRDLIRAESDVYAATGPTRERVMQTSNRTELVRQHEENRKNDRGLLGMVPGFGSGKR